MGRELAVRRLKFQTEVPLPFNYKAVQPDCGYRIDLVVDEKVAVELKSVEKLGPIHESQLPTYLRLSGMRVGY